VAAAVRLARDLVNEPAGSLTPSRLADVARAAAGDGAISLTVLDERGARAAGLGGLLGVARGSDQPPCLLELLYEPRGAAAATPTVAFVGKGITFDSGGLSLKTAQGMMTMKTDMSGAAAVLAAMTAIGKLGAPVRVLGLCPVTENMPGGAAIKPGDVLRIRNGKTVEVLNTDAEGRLVLADALCLAVEAGVDAIVDLATLTGAVSTALGRSVAGLLGRDEGWLGEVRAAAVRAGESVWPLPLPDEYRKDIDSDVADIRNTGGSNPAGTIIAGLFLEEFTGGLPWAHLDIAGTARSESEDGYVTKGGTGFGVRTLVELATAGRVPVRDGAVRRARWAGRTPVAKMSKPRPGGS
jgi:leucyl aminopeptidase